MTKKKRESWTLLKMLKEYEVIIPVIQRDYAHGRKGNEHIRRLILNRVHKKLVEESAENPLRLDFVYGEEKKQEGLLFPLDGQQRITTLWLIHWYLLLMKMVFTEKDRSVKKKFNLLSRMKYETRTSAKEFVSQMCSFNNMRELKKQIITDKQINLADLIKSRTWFYSEWLCDPTIEAMLRTISGDEDDRGSCIETIFNVDDKTKYSEYWLLLENGAVTFELQKLGTDELPDTASDDIYIKMNARGKMLSDFENFKADLVAWFNDEENSEKTKYAQKINGDTDKTWGLYFASQIDNAWTNVFWNKVNKGNRLFDPLFFSFINRYILNELCLKDMDIPVNTYKVDRSKVRDEYVDQRINFDKISGARLRGKSADDSLIKYEDFKYYRDYVTFDVIKRIDTVLTRYYKYSNDIDSFWNKLEDKDDDDKKYSFIPRYKDGRLTSTSLKERVLFLATCRYLEYQEDRENDGLFIEKYNHWMRVLNNLIRNYYYNDVSDMVKCLYLCENLMNDIREKDIYEYLNDLDFKSFKEKFESGKNTETEESDDFGIKPKTKEDRFFAQLFEEKQKAIALNNKNVKEEKLIQMENYWKFSGTIRFLFRTGIGLNDVDWNLFDQKSNNARNWFPIHLPLGNGEMPPDTELESLQAFLHLFTGFSDKLVCNSYLFPTHYYHNRDKNWKLDILCNDDYVKIVNDYLMQDKDDPRTFKDNIEEAEYKDFVNCDKVLNKIIYDTESNGKYCISYNEGLGVINKKSASKPRFYVYIGTEQQKACRKLSELNSIGKLKLKNPDTYNDYLWGRYIYFEFNCNQYALYAKIDEKKIVCSPCISNIPDTNNEKNWDTWLADNGLILSQ